MKVLADETQIATLMDRLAKEFGAEVEASDAPWAIVGIRSRGDVLAQRLARRVKVEYSGNVDIALYRDDLSEVGPQPIVRTTEIDFPIDGVNILLVDDVLMTGRSVRAAIQSLIDFGRPRKIKLMVLVDRGGRELPIAPDYVGQRVNTEPDQLVEVRITPTDPDDEIVMFKRPRKAEGRP
ncbi:bifunctional pyr operon transcriptional regulator/uracil phosphoribosyltransferase PyrR [Planctomycetales bacterium ZRK34]|nr:bifunctional pyr operon transcriptional regulator/uracil phosphoribosyltransferase PyrR [Planctomycetales bacterium ZRK34]